MDQELKTKIESALDGIRPYLEADGGNVKVLGIDRETLVLELTGACSSCPMSAMTLKAGVEEAIIRAVPEIKYVKAINVSTPDDLDALLAMG
ncbi:MAG: NifU family protein [Cyclobacteriaceae bacterium]|nr:NifU family protein [Cyclobacteriaceae bacterium]